MAAPGTPAGPEAPDEVAARLARARSILEEAIEAIRDHGPTPPLPDLPGVGNVAAEPSAGEAPRGLIDGGTSPVEVAMQEAIRIVAAAEAQAHQIESALRAALIEVLEALHGVEVATARLDRDLGRLAVDERRSKPRAPAPSTLRRGS